MDVAQAHTELIESVIEADDKLMESYLGGETDTGGEGFGGFCPGAAGRKRCSDCFYERQKRSGH